jgi:hypothetical protein
MSEQIKTITEREQFQDIFNKYFMNKEVFLKTKSGDLKITFMGYSDGLVAFKIPYVKNVYDTCLIFTKEKNNIIYANLKISEKQQDSYVFIPLKFQIISIAQKEQRKEIGGVGGRSILYITHMISDFIIENCLSIDSKKVDKVRELIKTDVGKKFNHIKVYFCNESSSDQRMKFFFEEKTPLFIPDFNIKKPDEGDRLFNYFFNNIYLKDYFLVNRKTYISEISVPILYKTKIPYGYVQVNNEGKLEESAFNLIKRVAISIDETFNKYKIFPQSDDRILVSDVSKSGIGIVFKERRLIRYFKERSLAYFDIILPGEKKASVLAIVRNIAILENKIIKVGCEFKDVDAMSEVNFDEYLSSIGIE